MRFATSLALAAACMVVVSLLALRSTRPLALAPAPAEAAELLSPDEGGSGPSSDQRNCPVAVFNERLHGEDRGNEIEGRRIFMRENCYICHGGYAGGAMCPSLRERRPDYERVREVVRNGTPNGMPRFPELTDQDIRNVATYFQTLRTCDEPTFTHWWEPVPTR
jgi:mono/diheme cytochrome c family protein